MARSERTTIRKFGRFLAFLLGVMLLLAIGVFYFPVIYPLFTPATFYTDVHGIDISHHQGKIDWKALKQDKVDFVFMKATEGDDFVDPRFDENWRGAKMANISRGAYHFFTWCSSPQAQARNFIKIVPNDNDVLPHVIDAEHMGRCSKGRVVKDMATAITTFLNVLEAHYGKRPIIYTTREFHETQIAGKLNNEKFWLRSLVIPPGYRTDQWIFWQYHNKGTRKGISGPVDLNTYRYSISDLKRLKLNGAAVLN